MDFTAVKELKKINPDFVDWRQNEKQEQNCIPNICNFDNIQVSM